MSIYKLTLSTNGPRFARFEISLLLKKCLVEFFYLTSKALFVVEIIIFELVRYSNVMTSSNA